MHLITVIFIGIIANIDNLVIGFSYGLKKTQIPFSSNFMIAVMSMICSLAALMVGHFVSRFLTAGLTNAIGGILLILIGGLIMWSTFYERKQRISGKQPDLVKIVYEPKKADLDLNNRISLKESIFLGFALALNSISTSFSVGLSDPSFAAYIVSIGLFSLISIWIGTRLGSRVKAILKNLEFYAPILSGGLLIMVGIYEIVL